MPAVPTMLSARERNSGSGVATMRQKGTSVHTVREAYDSSTCCNKIIVWLPGRSARMRGCAAHWATRSARPAMTPHCGPPKSLSPLNVTSDAPSARACFAAGSFTSHDGTDGVCPCSHGAVLSRSPDPISATTGTDSVASSRTDVSSVKPSIEKFDG